MVKKIDNSRNYLVVKDNALIQKARYSLTVNQQKLISYVISLIKPTDKDFKKYEISVSDFCMICGIDRNHFYKDLKNIIDNLDDKSFWVETKDKVFKFRWFSEVEYFPQQGKVNVMLNSNIKPYLIDLTKNFTSYELLNVLPLRSKYAIRLYEILKSYTYDKFNPNFKIFDLEELKTLLDASTYVYRDFNKRILDKTKEEINKYTDLKIDYEAIKTGRKVVAIKYTIEEKQFLDRAKAGYAALEKLDN